jgi:hypothetical protein
MMKNYKNTCQNTLTASGNNTEVHRKYLYKMLFITLMKEGGVMAQTIIRNYNNKQLKGKYEHNTIRKRNT